MIDGGIIENIPWKEWKNNGVDMVMCISFDSESKSRKNKNIIDIINNSLDLLCHELSTYEEEGIDYLLKIKTKYVSLLDVKKINYLYQMGYEQTKEFLNSCEI